MKSKNLVHVYFVSVCLLNSTIAVVSCSWKCSGVVVHYSTHLFNYMVGFIIPLLLECKYVYTSKSRNAHVFSKLRTEMKMSF